MLEFNVHNLTELQTEVKAVLEKYSLAKAASDYQICNAYVDDVKVINNMFNQNLLDSVACNITDIAWWEESISKDSVANDWATLVQNTWHGKLADMLLSFTEIGIRQRREPKFIEFETKQQCIEAIQEALTNIIKRRGNVIEGEDYDRLCSAINCLFKLDGCEDALWMFIRIELDVTLQKAVPSYRRETYNLVAEGDEEVRIFVSAATELGQVDYCWKMQQKEVTRNNLIKMIEKTASCKFKAFLQYPVYLSEKEYERWMRTDLKVGN